MIDLKILERLKNNNLLADFNNIYRDEIITGKVLEFNENFVVIHRADASRTRFDGLVILFLEDITLIRLDDRKLHAWTSILNEAEPEPDMRHFWLEDWQSIIKQLADRRCLITFYRQRTDEGVYIGYVEELFEESIMLHCVTADGEFDGKIIFGLEHITRLAVFGNYEKGLERIISANKEVVAVKN